MCFFYEQKGHKKLSTLQTVRKNFDVRSIWKVYS